MVNSDHALRMEKETLVFILKLRPLATMRYVHIHKHKMVNNLNLVLLKIY